MDNYHPYESNRCSMHHERPAQSQCAGCSDYFCGECLDEHGNCPACSNAAERFLEGFSTALSRWEAGLRGCVTLDSNGSGKPRGKRHSIARISVFLLAAMIGAYGVYFLSDYNVNMALLYIDQGNFPKAAQFLEKELKNQPDDANLHYMLGSLHYQLGDLESAADNYNNCLALDSTNATAMNDLAWIYTQLEIELGEALRLGRQAVELEPENPAFLDTLAEVYYLRKEYYRALTYLRKAVEQDPPDINYYLNRLEKIKKLAYGDGRMLEV
jgi:tetratricopeptide (TPR) repeat protein